MRKVLALPPRDTLQGEGLFKLINHPAYDAKTVCAPARPEYVA